MGQILRDLSKSKPDFHLAVVGVGSRDHGDDGAGPEFITHLQKAGLPEDRVLLIDGGPAPENFTGSLRRFQPEFVVLMDAAWMEIPAGSAALLEEEQIGGVGASTHGMPLSLLCEYLRQELGCRVALLAVQPGQTDWGASMGMDVKQAVKRMASELAAIYSRNISMRSPLTSS